MSLFKKPKSKISVRVTREDSDDESKSESIKPVDEGIGCIKKPQVSTGDFDNVNEDAGTPIILDEPSSVPSIVGEKKFDSKVKLKLSFGDDEEEETDVFQVKKSAYSRRIAKQMKREKKRKEKEEKLEEAKRNEKSSNTEIKLPFIDTEDKKSDEVLDFPPIFKEPDYHQFKPSKEGHIPSAKEIYAARKKREEDRKKFKMDNIIEDFISVEEETAAERIALGHMDDEQPVYEEEGDNDDDDDDDRIDFAVDREAMERERAREAFIQAQEEDQDTINRNRDYRDSDDSEDEIDLWEKEQIRKGVGSIGSTNRDQQPNNHLNDLMTKLDLPSTSDKSSTSSYIPSYLPKIPSFKATEEHIKQLSDDICDSISQINRQIAEDEQELKCIRAEREQLIVEVQELEAKFKETDIIEEETLPDLMGFWKKGQTLKPNTMYDTRDDDY